MLTNAIAEMRTYGEGFIIADQAPGLLDPAVIRNTNTKIALRLPEASDRELVGGSEALTDVQKTELARLPRGVAAVYQNDWIEAVLCKVEKAKDSGKPYCFVPIETVNENELGDPLALIELLDRCEVIDDKAKLNDIRCEMANLGLSSSQQVVALKMLENPPAKIQVSKIAPIVSTLLPDVREAVVNAKNRSKDPKRWSEAAWSALNERFDYDIPLRITRIITQAIVFDYVSNELRDREAFESWYRNGVM